MSALRLLLALAVPWTAGTLVASALLPSRGRLERIALGWPLGWATVMAALFVLLRLGLTVGPATALGPLALVGLAAALFRAFRRRSISVLIVPGKAREDGSPTAPPTSRCTRPSAPAMVFLALAAAVFLVKVALLLVAAAFVPIRHDDALVIWLGRAKVIAGLGRLPLDPADPLFLGGTHPDYPLFASLIPAWMALVAGEWRESWVGLPWPGFLFNLGLFAYAAARRRAGIVFGAVSAYFVTAMPLLLVHALRPGYADLPLAACFATGVVLLIDWLYDRRRAMLVPALVLLAACAALKREGLFLALAAALGLLVPGLLRSEHRRDRPGRVILPLVALLALGLTAALPWSFLPDTAAGLDYHPRVLPALAKHAWSWNSLALFGLCLPLGCLALALRMRRGSLGSDASSGTPAAAALFFLLLLACHWISVFLFTDNARFAFNDQTPGRLLIQFAPAAAFALLSVLRHQAGFAAPRGQDASHGTL